MILFSILGLVGLKYLMAQQIMPYHMDYLGDFSMGEKMLSLFLLGLKIIGASFLSIAISGLLSSYRFMKSNKDYPYFEYFFIPVFVFAGIGTIQVGFVTGSVFFALITFIVLLSSFRRERKSRSVCNPL